MKRYIKTLPIFLVFIIVACRGSSDAEVSDDEQIRDAVRTYLFLGDSVEVAAEITDTILVEELDGMLATIEDNLDKIQMDIDTLASIIDEKAYANLEYENSLYPESIDLKMAPKRLELAKYQLKMAELSSKKLNYQQSKRVMLHLRRKQLNSIAGYEIKADYKIDEETYDFAFLMSPDFEIID